ncbi:hypothetical protein [Lysobacter sp. D1-1-M9]|uniref:COG3904 family protein n=1 Tax=Novilysobacter longmucuonensis TaxID=3098603 RepID=UPI002FCBA43C
MLKRWFPVVCCVCLALSACTPRVPGWAMDPAAQTQTANSSDGGALVDTAAVEMPESPAVTTQEIDWAPMELTDGTALVSCEHDYDENGDGEPLASLGFTAIWRALADCRDSGMLRLRYQGKIDSEFPVLVERVAEVADIQGIANRILDIDSSGGRVEPAMRAGDLMGEDGWTVWVREDSICHSSCVLVVAAGDMRLLAGDIGIHRMIRIGSTATSRAELNEELRGVSAMIKRYLERHGTAVAVADLMMTVPNRKLRVLSADELDEFGLAGPNAAQDDLDRLRLARECGEAFVQRKDALLRAFDRQCVQPSEEVGDMGDCALQLRQRFGFPDHSCPSENPLAEYDRISRRATAARG